MNQNNDIYEFIKKVNLLDNRLSIYSLKLNLYSILPSYILSKKFFEHNIDLKLFTDAIFLKNPFKDYLYDSRTLLLARIIRAINETEDRQMLIDINNFIINHTNEIYEKNNSKPSKEHLINLYNKYSRNKE